MKYILVLAIALLTPLVTANIQIHEVLYDPVNTETGGEAVNLYNPTEQPIDISGYIIKTTSSEQDATIPNGTILGPKQYFLITDAGWSTLKDNPNWPNANYEEAITLNNENGSVAILNNGNIIDSLCWGGLNALCQGDPANRTQAGYTLLRVNETGNNAFDFIESIPQFKTSEGSDSKIQLKVIVTTNPPKINNAKILLDDDTSTEVIEIIPSAGKIKQIPIEVNASGASEVKVLVNGKEFNLTQNDTFTGFIEMNYFDKAQIYNVEIIASNPDGEIVRTTLTFEYLPLLALDIDATNLEFNESLTILGDTEVATKDRPTIVNLGNADINVGIYGTDLKSNSSIISSNNVKYSFDNDFESALAGTLSKNLEIKDLGLLAQQSKEFGLQISIPEQTPKGDYIGSLSLIGVTR